VTSGTSINLTGLESYNRIKIIWYRNESSGGSLASPSDPNNHYLVGSVNGGGSGTDKFGYGQLQFIGYAASSFYTGSGPGGTDLAGYEASAYSAGYTDPGLFIVPSGPSGGTLEIFDNLSSTAKSYNLTVQGRGSIATTAYPKIKFVTGLWNDPSPISSFKLELLYGSAGAFGRVVIPGVLTVGTSITVLGSTL
jgi:hypothetical protein